MRIIDSTLREGEQCFGVYFPAEAKRDILARLFRLGVDEVELGVAGRDVALADLMRFAGGLGSEASGPGDACACQAAPSGPQAPSAPGQADVPRPAGSRIPSLCVWAACREDAVLAGAALQPDWLHLGLPASEAHMRKRLGLDLQGLIRHLRRHVRLALSAGVGRVSVGLEDASRADHSLLELLAREAQEAGAGRVRLSDTVGLWHPLEAARISARFKAILSVPLGLHCHNDFGMGTANALAGLLSGADYADASVLGLGERAGLAALEELAAYLTLTRKADYRIEELPALCRAVAHAAGMDIPPRKPVVGAGQFACETGLHVHGLARDPALFEPYDPARLGLARLTALGKKSGRAAVAAKLRQLGLDPGGCDLEGLTRLVRAEGERLGRPLEDDEVRELVAGR